MINTSIGLQDLRRKLYRKAKAEEGWRFWGIYVHVYEWETIQEAYRLAKSNKGAPGIDGVTFEDIEREGLEAFLTGIMLELRDGSYLPMRNRVYEIPKADGSSRKLGIPTVIDRTLQRTVSKVLESIHEQDFCQSSVGGRPKRSAHNALATLYDALHKRRVNWVYEADLKSFFSSLNHEWAERFLSHRVADPRIATLIKRWLKAGVMEQGEFTNTELGTPQGGSISVLISYLYLHYALDLWIEKKVRPKREGVLYFFRYIDDFVLCFEHAESANRFVKILHKRPERFGLLLEPSKTRLFRFGRFAERDFARYNEKLEMLYFLGLWLYCSTTKTGRFKVGFLTERTRLNRFLSKMKFNMREWRHLPLREQVKLINQRLSGHFNYYGIISNYPALKRAYYQTLKYWRTVLSSRSQRGRMNWEKYRKVLSSYPLRTPRIR